jgi:hypothetical protein
MWRHAAFIPFTVAVSRVDRIFKYRIDCFMHYLASSCLQKKHGFTHLLTARSTILHQKLRLSFTWSRNSPPIVEPEGSWHSQEVATGPRLEVLEPSSHSNVPFLKFHFNIIIKSNFRYLDPTKTPAQFRHPAWHFATWFSVVSNPNSYEAGGPPLSAITDYLFNLLAVILHIWRISPLSASWGHIMLW